MPQRAVRAAIVLAALALALPATAAAAPPANDDQADARQIDVFEFDGADTSEATIEADEPLTANDPDGSTCTFDGDQGPDGAQLGKTIWYAIDGTGDTFELTSFDSDFDTVVAVYDDDDGGALVGCNDDALFSGGASFAGGSRVTFDTVDGHRYLIQVGGIDDGRSVTNGSASIVVTDETPANDDRAG